MRLLVIDGGATSTDVALCDQGSIVARTELPSVKPIRGDTKVDQLCLLLGSFLASTPLPADDRPDAVIIGMSGVWSDRERYEYSEAFNHAWTQYVSTERIPLVLLSDAELLLTAAHGAEAGAVLIGGTGSMMLMRQHDGLLQRVGGWGPAIDDAGGGMWLGRRAMRAVARQLDGRGPDTLLIRPVATYLRVDDEDVNAVRDALRRADASRLSRLATAVLYYADEADAVAMEIRREGALELAQLLTAVPPEVEVVVYGSLFDNDAYREQVTRFSSRPLTRLDDVIAALAERIHAAGQLPMSPI